MTNTFPLTLAQRERFQRARLSQDARFDGKFFIGVVTTGIFCRPICRVKPPKEENVRYYPSAIIAQQQGFRPCKRCLPELAPETPRPLSQKQLLNALLKHQGKVAAAANYCQLSERQFRRKFTEFYRLSPNIYWQQYRLLNALKLLRNSNMSMTQICFASGFSSIRRFNEAIRELYGETPKQISTRELAPPSKTIEIKLPYQGKYDWSLMLSFFSARQISDIETVSQVSYARVFTIDGAQGMFEVHHSPIEQALVLKVECTDHTVLPELITRVRRMFDLDVNLEQVHQAIGTHPRIKKVIEQTPGLRLPGCFDLFEFTIRAILGQQVSVKAATTLAQRICLKYGKTCQENSLGLSYHFPDNQTLLNADFLDIGLTQSRIDTLRLWCQYFHDNSHVFNYYQDIDELQQTLVQLKGIGPWTVNYIGMRGLSDPDAFPSADLGIIKALSEKNCAPKERLKNREIIDLAKQWQPWRAYAAIYLWQSLTLND
ncbi:DNA-3-methyladenine glycosylase 2 family protein [Thalassotalea sp. LPB0316]|uniref:DNA-3-methyladenine glycosylase 2 family protein n=1 Tax=Thalassotalea sp. LPB0316 TaxID=2769490 RepID=UPI0018692BB1|nr:DNA-3-methyladenine glycosylase 2 [Thalassotalea sp. LPB0316]QOL26852.1 DNA-3-methyladenine glycosylase 2 family protein [Thalassotalea sp. LPB0316]